MRSSRFFDWLTDLLPDWLARLLAAWVLASLLVLGYRGVRAYRAEQAATAARIERENAAWLRRMQKQRPGR